MATPQRPRAQGRTGIAVVTARKKDNGILEGWPQFSWKAWVYTGLIMLTITLAILWVMIDRCFHQVHTQSHPTLIDIQYGASSHRIAQILMDHNLFRSRYLIELNIWFRGYRGHLKAGEYRVDRQYSLQGLLNRMRKGHVALHKFTIPEGWSSLQIRDALNNSTILSGPKVIAIPEGSLLPETYWVPRHLTRQKLIAKMQNALQQFLDHAIVHNESTLCTAQVMVLASIVEKETALPFERSIVASVFLNRLKMGMRLQADPTVVYALSQARGQPFTDQLSRADLQFVHPSNTYVCNGLPPAPICHPGRAAINAVLHPAQSDYLYFVADGKGGHIFANNLNYHSRNHQAWRQIRQTDRRG